MPHAADMPRPVRPQAAVAATRRHAVAMPGSGAGSPHDFGNEIEVGWHAGGRAEHHEKSHVWLQYGAVIVEGVINTWIGLDKSRLKLRVAPAHAIPVGGADPRLRFSHTITSLSAFAVIIEEAGIFYSRSIKPVVWRSRSSQMLMPGLDGWSPGLR